MNCRDDVVERIHRIFLSAGVGSNKQLEAVRALGRAGGPKAAQLIEQIYQQAFSNSALQMACVAALGEAAHGFRPALDETADASSTTLVIVGDGHHPPATRPRYAARLPTDPTAMKLAILSQQLSVFHPSAGRGGTCAWPHRAHPGPVALLHAYRRRWLFHALQGPADDRRGHGHPAHRCLHHPLRHRRAAPVRTDGRAHANPSDAILRSRDKLRAHQLLAAKGIDMPVTVFGDNPDDTVDLLSMLGPPPHVVKLNEGTQGRGVILTEKASASRGIVEALRGLYANFLMQEFIGEAKGPTCAASWSATGWWRRCSGRHRRATSAPICTPAAPPWRPRPAVPSSRWRCARPGTGPVGLRRGPDPLRARPLVLEVNSTPGLEGIEAACGVDVATRIIEHGEDQKS